MPRGKPHTDSSEEHRKSNRKKQARSISSPSLGLPRDWRGGEGVAGGARRAPSAHPSSAKSHFAFLFLKFFLAEDFFRELFLGDLFDMQVTVSLRVP